MWLTHHHSESLAGFDIATARTCIPLASDNLAEKLCCSIVVWHTKSRAGARAPLPVLLWKIDAVVSGC